MRVVLLLLALAPLAAAGSAEDPEVSDGSGDSVSSVSLLGAVGAELVKGWYEEEGDNVVFRFEVGTLCADTVETIEYRWTTTVAGGDVAFGADLFGTGGFCTLAGSQTSISPTGATTAASMAGNIATLVVPKTAFGDGSDGTVLEGTFGTSRAYVGSPMVWNDSDCAPDDGGGRAYTLGPQVAVPDAPRAFQVNVTDAVLMHETNATEPLDAAYQLHWEGPANATAHFWMEGNGTVDVTVHAPDGTPLASCTCTGGANETHELAATAGTWNITVNYTAFDGLFRLVMAESQGDSDASPTTGGTASPANGDDTADTNSTESANTTAEPGAPVEDSPAVPTVLLLVALALVAWRRR